MNAQAEPERTDVAIVGAGAAGSLIAAVLAQAGLKVTVLEAGPAWQLRDLVSSQLWARRLKWRGAPVAAEGPHPIMHNAGTGSGFGGAALHHYGTWPRFSAENFATHDRYGFGIDWPIGYDTLRPYYDRVQTEVGISGDHRAEHWRPPGAAYPLPPLTTFRHGDLLAAGFRKLGKAVAPLPVAIASRPYRGRPPCIHDGWCDAGCPTGALANPLVTYLRTAREAGATFRADCRVLRVTTGAQGRVTGLDYLHGGRPRKIEARLVVLAANVAENVRLLLNSPGRGRHALADGSGLVGRYLSADCAVTAFGLFDEDTECYRGVNAGQYTYREGYRSEARPDGEAGYQWQIGPVLKPNDLFGVAMSRPELWGEDLRAFLEVGAHRMAMMIGFGGGAPLRENRITLSDRRDADGMPLAATAHRFPEPVLALAEHMQAEAGAVFNAAGAREAWTGRVVTGHLLGGTIMGAEPRASVTDSYGRCHDVDNLVIAGTSLFPCTGGVSPTFTLNAAALRTAEHLVDTLAAGA